MRRLFPVLHLLVFICLLGQILAPEKLLASEVGELVAADTGGLEARSAALILSGQEGGELAARVVALPLPGAAGEVEVALWVDVDGQALLRGHGEGSLLTEIYAYALGPDQGIAGYLTRAIRVEPSDHGDQLSQGGLWFQGRLRVHPGEYSLRVLVLQRSSGRFALQVQPLSVPVWDGEGAVMLPPLRLGPAPARVRVRATAEDVSLFPLHVGGASLAPAAGPLDPDQGGAVHVLGRDLPSEMDLRLLDLGGEERHRIELHLAQKMEQDLAGLDVVQLTLPPLDLPEGTYRLESRESGGDLAASASLSLAHRREDSEVVVEAEGETRRIADAAEAGNPGLSRREALYLGALQHLSAGDLEMARQAARAVEEKSLGDGSQQKKNNQLLQSQINVALRLVKTDPRVLVPLIAFHEEQYRRYHRDGLFLLSTHSRNLLALLNRLYLKSHEDAEAGRLVASAMVSLGDYLLETGAELSAQKAFERALEHDPDQPAALLSAARIEERVGLYEAAAKKLQHLSKIDPSHHEARLRLAVNLRRLDEDKDAERLLRRGLEGAPEWLTVLGYQELAALLFETDRGREAVELLAEGIEKYPSTQRLYLQRAALLDRLGRPAEAAEALGQLDPTTGRRAATPRLRYSQRSRWLAMSTRRALARESEEQMPLLSEGLAKILAKGDHALNP